MCGIVGKVYFDGSRRVEQDLLAAMCETLTHRGPNDQGVWSDGQTGLGSTRLSIIDLAGGHMPLSNEDGTVWIAFNGEIYNFRELRRMLEQQGHRFATRTDTETVVHLYEELGDDFVGSLNGMFALALWDTRRRRLVLARDQLGIKPLYYADRGDHLLFGSELKPLLAAGLDREIDPVALHDYLSLNYVPGPRTMFAEAKKLLPGWRLVFETVSGRIDCQPFWDMPTSGLNGSTWGRLPACPSPGSTGTAAGNGHSASVYHSNGNGNGKSEAHPTGNGNGKLEEHSTGNGNGGLEAYPTGNGIARKRRLSSADVEAELLALLRTVVADQMVSDVPVGAFLSGGLDSSLVVALMSEVVDRPISTFSVGFRERSYNELPWARIIADRFGTEHHELILEPDPHQIVTMLAACFDEPFADSSAVAVHAVSALAAQHVKVVLSGDGGDEVFGGYSTYQADQLAAVYRWLPKLLGARLLPALADRLPASDGKVSLDFKLKRFLRGASLPELPAHFAWKEFLSEKTKRGLYNADYLAGIGEQLRPTVELMADYWRGCRDADRINRLLYVDSKVQLPDDMLTKVDRASMAHSLEVRVPLLDQRLVEFMARLPGNWKVRRLKLKYLMKRVAAKILPPEILKRPKAGFHVPMARWIKSELKDLVCERLNPAAIERLGFFDGKAVQALLDAHWRGRCDYSRSIWNLLMFSLWHERYVAEPVAAPPGEPLVSGC